MKIKIVVLILLVTWLTYGCGSQSSPTPDLQATIDFLNQQNTRQAGPTVTVPTTPARATLPPPTFTSPVPTNLKVQPTFTGSGGLQVELQGCTTSVDIRHGLGEVTNAYVILSNSGSTAATNVCAELSASDEGKLHPDKLKCLPRLPEASQVALKLTVDTASRAVTILKVKVTADGGKGALSPELNCKSLTVSAERALNLVLDLIRPLAK